jgi:hypothetical protein
MYRVEVTYLPVILDKEGVMYKASIQVIIADKNYNTCNKVLPFIKENFVIDETRMRNYISSPEHLSLEHLKNFIKNRYMIKVKEKIKKVREEILEKLDVEKEIFEF